MLTTIQTLQATQHPDELADLVAQLATRLGFAGYCLTLIQPGQPIDRRFNNCPAWIGHYQRHHLGEIDPVLAAARWRLTPISWADIAEDSDVQTIMAAAQQYGIGGSIAYPLHGPRGEHGALNWISAQPITPDLALAGQLALLSPYILEAWLRLRQQDRRELSPLERECLQLICEGVTPDEIGKLMGFGRRMAYYHLHQARAKLRASNKYQCVALAAQTGLVTIDC